jgi:transposase
MDVIIQRCAGLDVHKETVQACVLLLGPDGRLAEQIRCYSTTTGQLLALLAWLQSLQVTDVAMESTGVFWKPIWNILEGFFHLLLVNPAHMKNVPGRKTDVKDCQWIAKLLQHGLLTGSFVPAHQQRVWRELTRQRTQLVAQTTQVANRIQKVLQDANIKLSSVASQVMGVSGRAMIQAMIAGTTDPATLAGLAKGVLKNKSEQLREALEGYIQQEHCFLLKLLMDQLEHLERLIHRLQRRIDAEMAGVAHLVELLDTIPGVDKVVAQCILAEVGTDMDHFPSDEQLAAWAGMCPGRDMSAGKRRSSRINPANRWLRRSLIQAGWAASHTKDTYLAAQYHRLAGRRGMKRALVAVGHTILVGVRHMLKDNVPWRDLGGDWFNHLRPDRLRRHLLKRLESLGYKVTLEPAA